MSADPRDFRPSIVRLQEAPPSPLGRAVLWVLLGFFGALLAWSAIGRLDIVAVADGRLVPESYLKIVQPADAGVVKEIAKWVWGAVSLRDDYRPECWFSFGATFKGWPDPGGEGVIRKKGRDWKVRRIGEDLGEIFYDGGWYEIVKDSNPFGVVMADRNQARYPIVVASIQTIANPRRIEQLGQFGVIVYDEAHHSVSPTAVTALRHLGMGKGLPTKGLGVTATWDRSDEIGLDAIWDQIVYQVDIESLIASGHLPVHFTYRQIVKQKRLVARRIHDALRIWATTSGRDLGNLRPRG